MDALLQDIRYGFRRLRQSPLFAGVAVLTLALGIGANTAMFSVMNALLLRSLPIERPDELVLLGSGQDAGLTNKLSEGPTDLFSLQFYRLLRDRNSSFDGVFAATSLRADVHGRFSGSPGEPEKLRVRIVSGNYFDVLGVRPAAGRLLQPGDDQRAGGHPVAVVSHSFWKRRFGRDPRLAGRSVSFNQTSFTIVGIAPEGFFGTVVGESPDLWVPLAMQAQTQPWIERPEEPLNQFLYIIARRKQGVSTASAQADTNVLYQQWIQSAAGASPSPDQAAGIRKARVLLTEARNGISELRAKFSEPLQILMVLVGLVLLIACANLANLMLARASARRRELSVRVALGASRGRLIAQQLAESLLLSFAGGAAGLLAASWGSSLLISMVSTAADPVALHADLDTRVFLFALGASLATGVFFGLAPALRSTRTDLAATLSEGKGSAGSRSTGAFARLLVAGQVALALFLLIGAGLFVRTLNKLIATGAGFDQEHVLVFQLDPETSSFKGAALVSLSQRIENRLQQLPNVQAASFSMLHFDGGRWMSRVFREGGERTLPNALASDGNIVGAAYFDTMGMPLIAGRRFTAADHAKAPRVAIVNETLARKLYPDSSPIGRKFFSRDQKDPGTEIVGVVRDARMQGLREKPGPMYFVYNQQAASGIQDLMVRFRGTPAELVSQVRSIIRQEDRDLAIAEVSTAGELVARSLTSEKLLARLSGFFGLLALTLAGIGLYGVLAYSVARRTSEIGIRVALGAAPSALVSMILRESLTLVIAGAAGGVAAALACGKLIASALYGLAPHDPSTYAAAAFLLLTVAVAASLLPAVRAARMNPLTALRQE